MKKLNLLDQSTSFKVNDTGTIIPFNAFENNQPFGVTENETLIFRIKNDMGFLKAVNATSAAGGYIFQLNTKDLVGLVPGTYEIELVVTDTETNGELIFPDNGFCSFNITTSALTVTGTQIPTMSLDSFKQQLEQYVQIQADNKTQQIKNDFSTYVESVKKGPQGEPGPAGAPGNDGKAATVVVGKTITADSGQSASVTNSGTSSAAILDFTLPAGPQGTPGTAATLAVGNVTSYKPWVCWDSAGKSYFKGYINSSGENANSSDIATDYFKTYSNDMYSISLPPTVPHLEQSKLLRIFWYDTNKNFVKNDDIQNLTFPYTWTVTSPCDGFARISLYVGDNSTADGTSQRIVVTDIGHSNVTNSGNSTNATFNVQLGAGSTGLTGPQGVQGPQGPQGSIGDYGVFTGWLDLTPYMDTTNVWATPDSSTYCKYAVTSFNGQNILWIRLHAKLRDASVAGKYGTTLFTIPSDVRSQYGYGEWSEFNTLYETCGVPCVYNLNKSKGIVTTQGYLPMINGSTTSSAPSGANKDCNLYAWFIL